MTLLAPTPSPLCCDPGASPVEQLGPTVLSDNRLVDVWELDASDGASSAPARLSSEEQRRAAKLIDPVRRRQWVQSRWAVRCVLAGYQQVDAAEVAWSSPGREHPRVDRWSVSLSHCGPRTVLAIAPSNVIVGVDTENRAAPQNRDALASFAAVAGVVWDSEGDTLEQWTRLEAASKVAGRWVSPDDVPDLLWTTWRSSNGEGEYVTTLAVKQVALHMERSLSASLVQSSSVTSCDPEFVKYACRTHGFYGTLRQFQS